MEKGMSQKNERENIPTKEHNNKQRPLMVTVHLYMYVLHVKLHELSVECEMQVTIVPICC